MTSELKKAMVLAAGFGTRLKPLTDSVPKALIKVNGVPMIELVLNRLIDLGIKEIVINTHHFAEQVRAYFSSKNFPVTIHLVHEEKILGTGGGIKNAARYLSGEKNFLVHNVDVLSSIDLKNLYTFHINNSAFVSLVVQDRETSRPLMIDEKNCITGRKSGEKTIRYAAPHGTDVPVAFCGIHIISSEIFSLFPDEDFFDIFTAYFNLIKQGRKIMGCNTGNSMWKDLGKYEDIINC